MSTIPPSHRVWQYESNKDGIENSIRLVTVPVPKPKDDEYLVQVVAVALNPVDYKPAEAPYVGGILVRGPATPGVDVAGRVVKAPPGAKADTGQLVFGAASSNPFAGGGLAEYISTKLVYPVPNGISPVDAASIPVAGLTAYQSIIPHVQKGQRILLNGGSGGVGLFGIQIAKTVGCYVTVTCSTKNVDFVKQYGADEVVDYAKGDVIEQLKKLQPFHHVVDNVGNSRDMYWRVHEFTTPKAVYVNVASSPTLSDLVFILQAMILPSWLGGGKRKYQGFMTQPKEDDLSQLAQWVSEGKIKTVIDEAFTFADVPAAFRRLKTGRARGKIVIDVTKHVSQ